MNKNNSKFESKYKFSLAKKKLHFLAVIFCFSKLCSQAPGGVSAGLQTWVKANTGVTGTTPVTAWANQVTTGTAVVVNGTPNLITTSTSYNYNPFIDFTAPVAPRQFLSIAGFNNLNGIDYRSLFFAGHLTNLTRLNTNIATAQNVSFANPPNGTLHGGNVGTGVATLLQLGYELDFQPLGSWRRNGTVVSYTTAHLSTKNIITARSLNNNPTTLNRFLGGQIDNLPFQGHTRDWRGPSAEIIAYTSSVSAFDAQKIESYLAVKYGVTLPIDYLSTTGSIIYNTTGSYTNNIIGIGRDDAEALIQKQSHQNDDTVRVYINNLAASNAANAGAFSNDVSYIIMGSDFGKLCPTLTSNSEVPPLSCKTYSRVEREWKVTNTNFSQIFNIDVTLNACANPGAINQAQLKLLIDDDGNFANGGTNTYFTGDGTGIVITYANPIITVSNISNTHIPINTTKYITFILDETPTLPPVNASATNSVICNGNSTILNGGGATTYTWTSGVSNGVAFSPTVTQSYTVTGTILAGCTNTAVITISVIPNPIVTASSTNSTVCVGNSITLNGAGASTYTWSSGVLNGVAFSPLVTQSYSVTGTSITGCTNSAVINVSVVPNPTVTAIATNSIVCNGNSTTLSGAGASTYNWSGGILNGVSFTPTVTTTYSVTGTTPFGCTNTAVQTISVITLSPIILSLPINVCQNGVTTLSASALGATGYSWAGPNNFTSNASTTIITNIQPAASGTYFSTALFIVGTVSCTMSGSTQINVVPVNSITVIPQISQCQPANISLQASSIGAISYSWNGPANYTSSIANPSLFNLGPNANGVYTVFTSYNNGALTCFNTNTTNVTINQFINFNLLPYTLTCYNSNLLINGPAGGTAYNWTSTNGYTSNSQNLNISSIQANQSGIYTLEVSLGPCKAYGTTKVEVLSPIQFSSVPNSRSICRGDEVKLTMQSIGGSGNYAYVWNPPLYLSSPTGSVQQGNPLGTTIYNVTGYDIACPNYTINHAFTIEVKQPPMPNLILDKNEGCQPLCLFLNSKTQTDAASTTYDFGSNLQIQADSFKYCLNNPGVYHLKIRSKGINGCSGVYNYPAPITVYPKPGTDISWSPETVTLSNNKITFTPSHRYEPVTKHSWMFSGTTINGIDTSNLRTPDRTYENIGRFPVMLVSTNEQSCIDTIVKFIDVLEDISVYIPNTFTPNGDGLNDFFIVKGTGLLYENFTCEIFDRWGSLVYFSKDISKGWDGSIKGVIASEGVYTYKVKVVSAYSKNRKEFLGHVNLMK